MSPAELGLPPGFRPAVRTIDADGREKDPMEAFDPVAGDRLEFVPNVYVGPARKIGPGVFEGRMRVTLGDPGDDPDHNCDAMGCGQDHVILREVLS